MHTSRVSTTRRCLWVAGLALCLVAALPGCGPLDEDEEASLDEDEPGMNDLDDDDEGGGRTVFATCPNGGKSLPPPRSFGSSINGYASYQGQTGCNSTPKAGVVAFRALVRATYPCTADYGISRGCGVGGTSEHKEGRAWDWGLNYPHPAATTFLNWLLATDDKGHKHAMARRLGIMYMVWNRKIWKSYQADRGWQAYHGSNPHTDHVHFSFSWDGALKKTSYWSAPAAPPPAPTPTNVPPKGNLEKVTCAEVSGWAQDPSAATAAVSVQIFFDKPAGATGAVAQTVKASLNRQDLCSKLGSCEHGFKLAMPAKLRDGKSHKVFAYALDTKSNSRTELTGSQKTFTCEAPAPAPAPTPTPTPSTDSGVPPQAQSDGGPAAPPDPSETLPLIPPSTDDSNLTTGGCSVGGSTDAALALFVPTLLLLGWARRRARAPRRS